MSEAQTLVPRPKIDRVLRLHLRPRGREGHRRAEWPGITLLKAQMNTDLLTEDLKKARSATRASG